MSSPLEDHDDAPGLFDAVIRTHPADSTVAVTTHLNAFNEACRIESYRAVILERDSAEKDQLRACINEFIRTSTSPLAAAFQLSAAIENGHCVTPKNHEVPEPLVTELHNMALAHHAATGTAQLRLSFLPGLKMQDPHPHSFPVLNCVWNAEGTKWENGQVQEGDWFFVKPGLYHWGPEQIQTNRVLALAVPKTPLNPP